MSIPASKMKYDQVSQESSLTETVGDDFMSQTQTEKSVKAKGNRSLLPIFFLTLGWFGIQMAMALDATMFQKLLGDQLKDATMIGLVLGFGPLAGFTLQPLMGWMSDKLLRRGITRRKVMIYGLIASLLGTLVFALPLKLPMLVTAIAYFFAAFNILAVNYRASVTEISNRKALLAHRGLVSGFLGGFGGLGGFAMFALVSASGGTLFTLPPVLQQYAGTPVIPVVASAVVLTVCFAVMYKFAPRPKAAAEVVAEHQAPEASQHEKAMWSPWNIAFYAFPLLSLLPGYEKKLVQVEGQKPIFRLFLTVFFSWVAVQALRGFFILFATDTLDIEFSQANVPLAVLTLVMLIVAPILGKLADKFDTARMLRFSLILYAISCGIGYFWVHDLNSLIALSVLIGVALAGIVVLPLAILLKLCPPKNEGIYSGFYNLFVSVPQLYSLFLTGQLIDAMHDYRMIMVMGAGAALVAVMTSFRMQSQKA